MNAARPTVAHFLLHGSTRKVQPGLIEKSELLIRTRNPDHYRGCVGHIPESLFAFTQRSFGFLALGDIRKEPEEPDRPRSTVYRHAGNADPYRRTICTAQAKIENPTVTGQSARKMTLSVRQLIRKNTCEAGLFGHRFEIGAQN